MRDLRAFSDELPNRIPRIVAHIKRVPIADKIGIDSIVQRTEAAVTATAGYVVTSLPNWLSHIFDILSTSFLCIYFMLEGENAYRFFLSLFPSAQRHRLDATLQRADRKVSKWLLGQGTLMLVLGISSTIVFGFLHVRYFVLLGFLMGLTILVALLLGTALAGVVGALVAVPTAAIVSVLLEEYAVKKDNA
jgi:predicted PurR-regulated permease PerM